MKGQDAIPVLTARDQQAHDKASGTNAEPPRTGPQEGTAADEPQPQFRVITCVLGATTHTDLTAKEVLQLNADGVDFAWDRVFGRVSIRGPNGHVQEYVGEIPGLGPDVGIPFLEDVLWAMGESITAEQVRGSIRSRWQNRNNRDRQVARMRKAFGDNVIDEYYFIVRSRPWRIAWNVDRSWRLIERR